MEAGQAPRYFFEGQRKIRGHVSGWRGENSSLLHWRLLFDIHQIGSEEATSSIEIQIHSGNAEERAGLASIFDRITDDKALPTPWRFHHGRDPVVWTLSAVGKNTCFGVGCAQSCEGRILCNFGLRDDVVVIDVQDLG